MIVALHASAISSVCWIMFLLLSAIPGFVDARLI